MSRTNDQQHSPIGVRVFVIALLAALVSTLFTLAAPAASAQPFPEFVRITYRPTCNADETTLAPATDLFLLYGPPHIHQAACAPVGFYPVRTEALCRLYFPDSWLASASVCRTGVLRGPNLHSTGCRYPNVGVANYDFAFGPLAEACAIPILSNAAAAPRAPSAITPVCIEDVLVQDDPVAALSGEGDSFVSSIDGTGYVIVIGAAACTYGCYDGFDMNCDGVLGDYCPVEIDHRSVRGVAACRAATGASSPQSLAE